jgi:dTDP-4-amino-4,6-dideoxygalactose transaminase
MTWTALNIPSWPIITQVERDAVDRVLASGRINAWGGTEVSSFEDACAEAFEVDHALAVCNGTVALERALEVLDVGPGDDVLVTPRSFLASASCVVRRGARPIFADVDLDSQCLTPATLEAARTPRTKAVVLVHLAGWPCDVPAIMQWAEPHNIAVVEDASQAHGAAISGKPVGGIGHVGCFSFCQDKIITSGGEGGLITTNDPLLYERLWSLRDHGRNRAMTRAPEPEPGFRWQQTAFGSNDRMTEMQAAIGRVQLADLQSRLEARRRNARLLHDAVTSGGSFRSPWPSERIDHAWYRYHCFAENREERDRILEQMHEAGVPCFQGPCPEIYREQAFADAGFVPADRLPVARHLGETSLQFLTHHTIGEACMHQVADRVAEVLERV